MQLCYPEKQSLQFEIVQFTRRNFLKGIRLNELIKVGRGKYKIFEIIEI